MQFKLLYSPYFLVKSVIGMDPYQKASRFIECIAVPKVGEKQDFIDENQSNAARDVPGTGKGGMGKGRPPNVHFI